MQATSKGSDQAAHMRRLVCGFAGRTYHIVRKSHVAAHINGVKLLFPSCFLEKKKIRNQPKLFDETWTPTSFLKRYFT